MQIERQVKDVVVKATSYHISLCDDCHSEASEKFIRHQRHKCIRKSPKKSTKAKICAPIDSW